MRQESMFGGRGAAVLAAIVLISLLHHLIRLSRLHWHNIFQYLYYLPIAWAALSFGWRGGLATAILAGISDMPHIIMAWKTLPDYAIDQVVDVPLFCAAGIFTGLLAERERKQRSQQRRLQSRPSRQNPVDRDARDQA